MIQAVFFWKRSGECKRIWINLTKESVFIKSCSLELKFWVLSIRQFTMRIISSISRLYLKIFLVFDTFRQNSIKTWDKKMRGFGEKYEIKLTDMRVPVVSDDFIINSSNKATLTKLMKQTCIKNNQKLDKETIAFYSMGSCSRFIID